MAPIDSLAVQGSRGITSEEGDSMTNAELNEWDLEVAEVKPPVKKARTVVSVAFNRHDFDVVGSCAAQMGLPTSTFIRQAALEKASQPAETISLEWTGLSAGSFGTATDFAPNTRISSQLTHEPDFVPVAGGC